MTITARLAGGVFVAVGVFWCAPIAHASGSTGSDAVDPNGTLAVVGGESIRAVFSQIGSQRVEFVILGDSNANFGSAGWAEGLPSGLDQQGLACFATGMIAYNTGGSGGIGLGWRESDIGADGGASWEGAPRVLGALLPSSASPPAMSPHKHGWVDAGAMLSPAVSRGINISSNHPLDVSGPLRARVAYATFLENRVGASNAYRITPTIRRGSPPWSILASEQVSTLNPFQVSAYSMTHHDLLLDAGARAFGIQYRLSNPLAPGSGGGIAGEAYMTWMRVFNDDRDSGWAVTVLDWAGGANAHRGLERFGTSGDAMHWHAFSELRQSALDCGQTPRVVFMLTYGMNDHGDITVSVDGVHADGSPEGYRANVSTFIEKIRQSWVYSGFDPEELRFVLVPSHPTDAPSEVSLVQYRAAAAAIAESRSDTTAVNLRALISGEAMREAGYLDSGGYHMSSAGYQEMGRRLVELLAGTECVADLDGDGDLSNADLFSFLESFFAGSSDVNNDGVTTSDDFFVFLDLFFAGCPGR